MHELFDAYFYFEAGSFYARIDVSQCSEILREIYDGCYEERDSLNG